MVGVAAPRHLAGALERRAPVMLREDQLHGLLEHRARRAALCREPLLELVFGDAEELRQALPAAAQKLALVKDPGAHVRPSRVLDHGARASKGHTYSGLMLAARATRVHLAISPRMKAENSAGELPTGSAPSAA